MTETTSTDDRPSEDLIDRSARRARRLIFAAALSLFAIALLGALLGLDTWPETTNALRQWLAHVLPDTGPLLVVVPAAGVAGTVLALRQSRRVAAGEAHHLARSHAIIAVLAVLYALAMALVGWQHVQSLRRSFQHERLDQQIAVARLKAEQIDDWTRERKMNLQFLGRSLATLPLATFRVSPPLRQLVELTLAQFLASNPERIAAGLFLADGTALVTVGSFDPAGGPALQRTIRDALSSAAVAVSPVQPGGATPAGVSLAFAEAIEAGVPERASTRLVVVSVLDPTLGVLKGFNNWPTASRTSEIELVLRAGDEVVHIVPDRAFQAAPPLSLRNRVLNDRLVGAQVATSGLGQWDALDHHGKRVLAASFHATALPWIVIAKTDYAEAMQPIEWESRKIWAMIVALILFGGVLSLALGAQLTMADALQHERRPRRAPRGIP